MTLPRTWYGDPGIHERERQRIFGAEWLYFGFASRLAVPGDYVADEIAGWNVLVVMDDDGTLRAHHNVCRHRAGPLLPRGTGRTASLVCRYHGWAYALDGTLRSARDFGGGIDCDAVALHPVHVAVWRGLVFVNMGLGPDQPIELERALGSFVDACAAFPIESFVPAFDRDHELACNWKTYADNYLEGYHIPLVHPGLNKDIDAKHYRVDVDREHRWIEQHAPARDRADERERRWLWRWPNLAVNLYAGGVNLERYEPLGPRSTRLRYSYAFADPDRAAESESLRLTTEVTAEDIAICEAVQRNLDSGVYDEGWLSPRHENGVAAFQEWVRRAVERD